MIEPREPSDEEGRPAAGAERVPVAAPRRLATLGELLEAKHQEFVGRIRERERRSE